MSSGNVLVRSICRSHDLIRSGNVVQAQRHGFASTSALYVRGDRVEKTVDYNKVMEDEKRGVFRVLDIGLPKPYNPNRGRTVKKIVVKAPPREKLMKPDQDWTSVWPATRTFHPAVVPLPVRQGMRPSKKAPTPSKWANAELMKIPNFLHLTPPAIKKHCQELKQFCTEFPKELENEDEMDLNLPLTEVTTDYLNASSSIRDFRSRIVTLKFRLSTLGLDAHARDKFMRLVGEDRYDYKTDLVTIQSDRLPYRKQNREYCEYLIKALYFESNKVEEWESQAEDADSVNYELEAGIEEKVDSETLEYMKAYQNVLNRGEDDRTIDNYKSKVLQMFDFKNDIPVTAEKV